jgi:hypothetical protein
MRALTCSAMHGDAAQWPSCCGRPSCHDSWCSVLPSPPPSRRRHRRHSPRRPPPAPPRRRQTPTNPRESSRTTFTATRSWLRRRPTMPSVRRIAPVGTARHTAAHDPGGRLCLDAGRQAHQLHSHGIVVADDVWVRSRCSACRTDRRCGHVADRVVLCSLACCAVEMMHVRVSGRSAGYLRSHKHGCGRLLRRATTWIALVWCSALRRASRT